jgi:hypothetical protein
LWHKTEIIKTLVIPKDAQLYSLIHLVVCLTIGSEPLPKRALHMVLSRASSFKWEYPLLSLSSSSSFLRLLLCLPVTSIRLFIFPSITCCRISTNYGMKNYIKKNGNFQNACLWNQNSIKFSTCISYFRILKADAGEKFWNKNSNTSTMPVGKVETAKIRP